MTTPTTSTTPLLIERRVTLLVSQDTSALWDAMARRLGLDSFDEMIQVISLYGAFLLASADLGMIEGIDVTSLDPDALRAVIVPWLQQRTREEPGGFERARGVAPRPEGAPDAVEAIRRVRDAH